MSEPADVLAELKAAGLLDRAGYVKAGGIEVQLGPPAHTEPASAVRPISREQEMQEAAESVYGASRGMIPGVS